MRSTLLFVVGMTMVPDTHADELEGFDNCGPANRGRHHACPYMVSGVHGKGWRRGEGHAMRVPWV